MRMKSDLGSRSTMWNSSSSMTYRLVRASMLGVGVHVGPGVGEAGADEEDCVEGDAQPTAAASTAMASQERTSLMESPLPCLLALPAGNEFRGSQRRIQGSSSSFLSDQIREVRPRSRKERSPEQRREAGEKRNIEDRRNLGGSVEREGAAIPVDEMGDGIDREDPSVTSRQQRRRIDDRCGVKDDSQQDADCVRDVAQKGRRGRDETTHSECQHDLKEQRRHDHEEPGKRKVSDRRHVDR